MWWDLQNRIDVNNCMRAKVSIKATKHPAEEEEEANTMPVTTTLLNTSLYHHRPHLLFSSSPSSKLPWFRSRLAPRWLRSFGPLSIRSAANAAIHEAADADAGMDPVQRLLMFADESVTFPSTLFPSDFCFNSWGSLKFQRCLDEIRQFLSYAMIMDGNHFAPMKWPRCLTSKETFKTRNKWVWEWIQSFLLPYSPRPYHIYFEH